MLAEISIIPVGEGVSISSHVARMANIIDESGLDYKINPMATVIEGDFDEVMRLVKKCHETIMEEAERVIINVVIDDRRDKTAPRLDKKLESVEQKAGKTLKK
ncbi:MAG: MTH1187 family thiamine-binding protein [Candidatus Omnitrophota bacterium]